MTAPARGRRRRLRPAAAPATPGQAKSLRKQQAQARRYAKWARASGLDPTATLTWCAYAVLYATVLGRSCSHIRAVRDAVRRHVPAPAGAPGPTRGPLADAVLTSIRRREKDQPARGPSPRLTAAIADAVGTLPSPARHGGQDRPAMRVARAAATLSLSTRLPWTALTGVRVRDIAPAGPSPRLAARPRPRPAGAPDPASLLTPCACPPAALRLRLAVTVAGQVFEVSCSGDQACPVDAVNRLLLLHDDPQALLLGLCHSPAGTRRLAEPDARKAIRNHLRAAYARVPGAAGTAAATDPDPRLLDPAARLLLVDALDAAFAFPPRNGAWAHLLRAVGRRDREATSARTDTMTRDGDGWTLLIEPNKRRGPRPGRAARPAASAERVLLADAPEAVRALDRQWLVLAAANPDPARPGRPLPGPFLPAIEGPNANAVPAKPGEINPPLRRACEQLGLPPATSQGGKRDHLTGLASNGAPAAETAARGNHAWPSTTWLHYIDRTDGPLTARRLDPGQLPRPPQVDPR